MKKDVIISLNSLIETGGEPDRLLIETVGKMMYKDSVLYLTYKETEQSGYDGCSVLVKMEGEDLVSITRSGEYTSHLVIQSGKRNICSYESPAGVLSLGLSCDKIDVKYKNDEPCEICLKYEMDINSELVSKNQLIIKIKERKN